MHGLRLDEGATHYKPIEWADAYELIAQEIKDMEHSDQSVFYTSGRTSNEAAFAYQLLVRGIGTNNLPDCSNMCHVSPGSALVETIDTGKGSGSLTELETAPSSSPSIPFLMVVGTQLTDDFLQIRAGGDQPSSRALANTSSKPKPRGARRPASAPNWTMSSSRTTSSKPPD